MNFSEERTWYREITIHYEDTPAAVRNMMAVRTELKNAMNELEGVSGREFDLRIYLLGMHAASENPELRAKINPELLGWEQELADIQVKKQQERIMLRLYSELPLDEFIAHCEERHLPHGKFLEKYTWRAEDLKWSDRARSWLKENVIADGLEHDTSAVRTEAVADELIDNDPEEWRKLSALARRMGLTEHSAYGTWKRDPAFQES